MHQFIQSVEFFITQTETFFENKLLFCQNFQRIKQYLHITDFKQLQKESNDKCQIAIFLEKFIELILKQQNQFDKILKKILLNKQNNQILPIRETNDSNCEDLALKEQQILKQTKTIQNQQIPKFHCLLSVLVIVQAFYFVIYELDDIYEDEIEKLQKKFNSSDGFSLIDEILEEFDCFCQENFDLEFQRSFSKFIVRELFQKFGLILSHVAKYMEVGSLELGSKISSEVMIEFFNFLFFQSKFIEQYFNPQAKLSLANVTSSIISASSQNRQQILEMMFMMMNMNQNLQQEIFQLKVQSQQREIPILYYILIKSFQSQPYIFYSKLETLILQQQNDKQESKLKWKKEIMDKKSAQTLMENTQKNIQEACRAMMDIYFDINQNISQKKQQLNFISEFILTCLQMIDSYQFPVTITFVNGFGFYIVDLILKRKAGLQQRIKALELMEHIIKIFSKQYIQVQNFIQNFQGKETLVDNLMFKCQKCKLYFIKNENLISFDNNCLQCQLIKLQNKDCNENYNRNVSKKQQRLELDMMIEYGISEIIIKKLNNLASLGLDYQSGRTYFLLHFLNTQLNSIRNQKALKEFLSLFENNWAMTDDFNIMEKQYETFMKNELVKQCYIWIIWQKFKINELYEMILNSLIFATNDQLAAIRQKSVTKIFDIVQNQQDNLSLKQLNNQFFTIIKNRIYDENPAVRLEVVTIIQTIIKKYYSSDDKDFEIFSLIFKKDQSLIDLLLQRTKDISQKIRKSILLFCFYWLCEEKQHDIYFFINSSFFTNQQFLAIVCERCEDISEEVQKIAIQLLSKMIFQTYQENQIKELYTLERESQLSKKKGNKKCKKPCTDVMFHEGLMKKHFQIFSELLLKQSIQNREMCLQLLFEHILQKEQQVIRIEESNSIIIHIISILFEKLHFLDSNNETPVYDESLKEQIDQMYLHIKILNLFAQQFAIQFVTQLQMIQDIFIILYAQYQNIQKYINIKNNQEQINASNLTKQIMVLIQKSLIECLDIFEKLILIPNYIPSSNYIKHFETIEEQLETQVIYNQNLDVVFKGIRIFCLSVRNVTSHYDHIKKLFLKVSIYIQNCINSKQCFQDDLTIVLCLKRCLYIVTVLIKNFPLSILVDADESMVEMPANEEDDDYNSTNLDEIYNFLVYFIQSQSQKLEQTSIVCLTYIWERYPYYILKSKHIMEQYLKFIYENKNSSLCDQIKQDEILQSIFLIFQQFLEQHQDQILGAHKKKQKLLEKQKFPIEQNREDFIRKIAYLEENKMEEKDYNLISTIISEQTRMRLKFISFSNSSMNFQESHKKEVRQFFLQVVGILLMQGKLHFFEVNPYLIALLCDNDEDIRKLASSFACDSWKYHQQQFLVCFNQGIFYAYSHLKNQQDKLPFSMHENIENKKVIIQGHFSYLSKLISSSNNNLMEDKELCSNEIMSKLKDKESFISRMCHLLGASEHHQSLEFINFITITLLSLDQINLNEYGQLIKILKKNVDESYYKTTKGIFNLIKKLDEEDQKILKLAQDTLPSQENNPDQLQIDCLQKMDELEKIYQQETINNQQCQKKATSEIPQSFFYDAFQLLIQLMLIQLFIYQFDSILQTQIKLNTEWSINDFIKAIDRNFKKMIENCLNEFENQSSSESEEDQINNTRKKIKKKGRKKKNIQKGQCQQLDNLEILKKINVNQPKQTEVITKFIEFLQNYCDAELYRSNKENLSFLFKRIQYLYRNSLISELDLLLSPIDLEGNQKYEKVVQQQQLKLRKQPVRKFKNTILT